MTHFPQPPQYNLPILLFRLTVLRRLINCAAYAGRIVSDDRQSGCERFDDGQRMHFTVRRGDEEIGRSEIIGYIVKRYRTPAIRTTDACRVSAHVACIRVAIGAGPISRRRSGRDCNSVARNKLVEQVVNAFFGRNPSHINSYHILCQTPMRVCSMMPVDWQNGRCQYRFQ